MADRDVLVQSWSLRRGERLATLAREAGWRSEHVTDGFGAGVSIAVIDAAGGIGAAEEVLAAAQSPVALAIVDNAAPAVLDRLYEAGATQVAVVGDDGEGLVQALRFAERGLATLQRPRGRERRGARQPGSRGTGEWMARHLDAGASLTVIHVALLRFDLVNAAHGRRVGTALVKAAERRVAAQVRALVDENGLVARVEGPGLVATVAGPAERAILLAARIEEALASPFRIGEVEAVLGCRIGIAGARPGDDPAAAIARAARDLLPDALIPSGTEADGGAAMEALAVDIHLAMARGEVGVRYQPQVTINDEALVGVEALARWDHPRLGPLGAGTLLAAAERAGLGLALSEHIQRLALRCASDWPNDLGALRLSLNLTAADLARPGFVDTFLAHIDASGFPRGRLTLEITETGLMADLDAAAGLLARLRGAGCRVAIDDFGTGYSSLAYLKALPVDYLKIDKALAQDIAGSARDQVVVRGAIDMARSLGIVVIAEGVETTEQRDLLAAAGCSIYQGFLFAEPLDEAALIALVDARR
jgi:EAL domain-containing protein (putative c-di-GMP-specific phosphodiesterase class I)/GGDEF domain-containing protein